LARRGARAGVRSGGLLRHLHLRRRAVRRRALPRERPRTSGGCGQGSGLAGRVPEVTQGGARELVSSARGGLRAVPEPGVRDPAGRDGGVLSGRRDRDRLPRARPRGRRRRAHDRRAHRARARGRAADRGGQGRAGRRRRGHARRAPSHRGRHRARPAADDAVAAGRSPARTVALVRQRRGRQPLRDPHAVRDVVPRAAVVARRRRTAAAAPGRGVGPRDDVDRADRPRAGVRRGRGRRGAAPRDHDRRRGRPGVPAHRAAGARSGSVPQRPAVGVVSLRSRPAAARR